MCSLSTALSRCAFRLILFSLQRHQMLPADTGQSSGYLFQSLLLHRLCQTSLPPNVNPREEAITA